jgi:hypothetical protein
MNVTDQFTIADLMITRHAPPEESTTKEKYIG